MTINRTLVLIALILAILSFVVPGFPLLAAAVVLLAIAQLV